jgi:hypothetical protein
VCEDSILKHPRAINYDTDGKITNTSSILVLFSHGGHSFVWRGKRDPQFSHAVARACKIRMQLGGHDVNSLTAMARICSHFLFELLASLITF